MLYFDFTLDIDSIVLTCPRFQLPVESPTADGFTQVLRSILPYIFVRSSNEAKFDYVSGNAMPILVPTL